MRMHTPLGMNPRRRAERGVALVFVTFAIAALLVAITGALVTGSANSRATSNYKGASQVHYAAESGILEAVQRINQTGALNFQNDIVNQWDQYWGSTWHTAPLSGFSYSVAAVANPGNPADRGRLIASARGPNNLSNQVVAEILRTNTPATAPGALYLATDSSTNTTFNGANFFIDGNDHNYLGGMGTGDPVPGLSTRNQTNTDEAIGSLNSSNADRVQGLNYQAGPPTVPSIGTSSWAPSVSQINQFVQDLINIAGPGGNCKCTDLNNSCVDSSLVDNTSTSCNLGTNANPRITWWDPSTNVTVKQAGNITGAGVLIIQSDYSVLGTINFNGLIIVNGQTKVSGNAQIFGSLWTQSVDMTVSGAASIDYSVGALALASQVIGGAYPSTIKVTALADCSQIPSGANGCP